MNPNHLHAMTSAGPQIQDAPRQFLHELVMDILAARKQAPKDTKVEVLCGDLRVRRLALRPGELLIVDGLDASGNPSAILAHYTNVTIQIVLVDQNQHDTPAPQMGFHTLFRNDPADPGSDWCETHPTQ